MRATAGYPVRVRFAKQGKVRFISHRDVARAFERAFRIEELPLAFTQGFSPRPKVSFGLALSVGHESVAEYLDVELAREVPLPGMADRLSTALPDGVTVTGVVALADRAPALQEAVTSVCYRVAVAEPSGRVLGQEELRAAADRIVGDGPLVVRRTRKGKESDDDIRPAVRALAVGSSGDGGATLELELGTVGRGARPREVVDAIAAAGHTELSEHRVMRTAQWIERDGARLEPLEADALARTPEVREMREGTDVRRDHPGDASLPSGRRPVGDDRIHHTPSAPRALRGVHTG